MSTFGGNLSKLRSLVDRVRRDSGQADESRMPGQAYVLESGDILCCPREIGDSRYPYGENGFNFWAYSSGYMHCNEGLFSPFLRAAEGHEPNIAFFVATPSEDSTYETMSILPVPLMGGLSGGECDRYTVLTKTAAYYFLDCQGLRTALRVAVLERGTISFSLSISNEGKAAVDLIASSYLNPYLRHQLYESGEDRWFKEVRILSPSGSQELGNFLVKVNEDKSRQESVSHFGIIQRHIERVGEARLTGHEETTSRYKFVGGSLGSLHTPASLRMGTFGIRQTVCAFTETGVAGDMLKLHLEPSASLRYDIVFSYTDDREEAESRAAEVLDPSRIDAVHAEREQEEDRRNGSLRIEIGAVSDERLRPKVFGTFLEHLKKQVEFCALIRGYVQLSEYSLIGIRDVFQALEALAFWQPEEARKKMLEALGYTAPDGRCFRQYSLPLSTGETGRMDLRPFIDQGCWVIHCVNTYLRLTGDLAFLAEPCGYHEIVNEASGRVRPSKERDTVLDHLIRIMDFLLVHRDFEDTGCVRAMYGDWNDALDGLGVSLDPNREYGSGVSVMATLQVLQNTSEMIEILSADGIAHHRKVGEYEKARAELTTNLKRCAVVEKDGEQRIVHGWGDERSYFVGSFKDSDGLARDGLTSNAFWVLADLCSDDGEMQKVILDAFDRLDSKYGFKTFSPAFAEDAPGVGRIGKLPPGTAENAAAYIHATTFAVMALFKMGEPERAWEQLMKILPFTEIHERLSHSPFVMPNSYGLNEDLGIDGECMNDWQTGSSNVLLKTLIRFVFGCEPVMDGVIIQPPSWLPFKRFTCSIPLRGHVLTIDYENAGAGERSFSVNGNDLRGEYNEATGITCLRIGYDDLSGSEVKISVRD